MLNVSVIDNICNVTLDMLTQGDKTECEMLWYKMEVSWCDTKWMWFVVTQNGGDMVWCKIEVRWCDKMGSGTNGGMMEQYKMELRWCNTNGVRSCDTKWRIDGVTQNEGEIV